MTVCNTIFIGCKGSFASVLSVLSYTQKKCHSWGIFDIVVNNLHTLTNYCSIRCVRTGTGLSWVAVPTLIQCLVVRVAPKVSKPNIS